MNGKGEEINRMIGGAGDTQSFIDRIEESLKPENSWAHHEKQYQADPMGYAMTYINALKSTYMYTKANELFDELFAKRTMEENFNDESIEYYKKNVTTLDHTVFTYMLDNKKAVSKVMGKTEYNDFIKNVVNSSLTTSIMRTKSAEDFKEKTKVIAENKKLQNIVYNFFTDNLDDMYANNGTIIIANTLKIYKKLSPEELDILIPAVITRSKVKNVLPAELKEDAKTLILYAQDKTTNENQKRTYGFYLKATE